MNNEIEGVILAGGESKRMGENKSLIKLYSKTLVEHVYDRLKDQVSHVSINTNQPIKQFPRNIQFQDLIQTRLGPLAGIQAGLIQAKKSWVQFCPNDCPFLPIKLVERLSVYIKDKGPSIIVPTHNNVIEPAFTLCHRSLIKNLESFLNSGERKMELWIKENNYVTVNFTNINEFTNINTLEELKKIESEI